jgi:hypothetical protein
MGLGKPSKETFDFAKEVIKDRLGGSKDVSIYMVGGWCRFQMLSKHLLTDTKDNIPSGEYLMHIYNPDSDSKVDIKGMYFKI